MAAAKEEENGSLYYFAIGSMLNPPSVVNRGIHFESASPGKLPNHKIHWFGFGGFAEAIEAPDSDLHGVIYKVSFAEMAKLDKIERGYVRKMARAMYYDGSEVNVTVYCRSASEKRGGDVDSPPTQRYLDVIIEGARHYGLDPNYIQMLEQTNSQPRPEPSEFLSFGEATQEMPLMTLSHVQENNGHDGKPLYITSNGKVLEFVREEGDKYYKETIHFHQGERRHVELMVSKLLYDCKYGAPKSLGDFSREHSAYTEHMLCDFCQKEKRLQDWKIVGRFVQMYKE